MMPAPSLTLYRVEGWVVDEAGYGLHWLSLRRTTSTTVGLYTELREWLAALAHVPPEQIRLTRIMAEGAVAP